MSMKQLCYGKVISSDHDISSSSEMKIGEQITVYAYVFTVAVIVFE